MLENLSWPIIVDAVRYFFWRANKGLRRWGHQNHQHAAAWAPTKWAFSMMAYNLAMHKTVKLTWGVFRSIIWKLSNSQRSKKFDVATGKRLRLGRHNLSANRQKHRNLPTANGFISEQHSRPALFGLANPALLWQQKIGRSASSSASVEYIHANGRYKPGHKLVETMLTVQ